MTDTPKLKLYNTLTRQKEVLEPIDTKNVRMYVCGPTVYDFAHIGNARPAIVFDVLFRLLRHVYGKDHVTYVRNITDLDDKINARALRDFGDRIAAGEMSLNEAIRHVTEKTATQYHADVKALGCLEPTHEPRATEFVLPREDGKSDMVTIIQALLDKGHAYIAKGSEGREVLFDVTSMKDYGALSNRKLEDQQAGARIAVESHKKNPGDFVLWKESSSSEPGWDGEFVPDPNAGYHAEFEMSEDNRHAIGANSRKITIHGRPGWHIECSAMSDALLWDAVKDRLSPEGLAHPHMFDIHGGGLDLIFPHHENEIAQSCCAHDTKRMANIWMHNGYLQVEGKKMSKSDGNFVTIQENTRGIFPDWNGGALFGLHLRAAMLLTHYREPIDWTKARFVEARQILDHSYRLIKIYAERNNGASSIKKAIEQGKPDPTLIEILSNDLDTPAALQRVAALAKDIKSDDTDSMKTLIASLDVLGLVNSKVPTAVATIVSRVPIAGIPIPIDIVMDLNVATANNDFEFAVTLGNEINNLGYSVTVSSSGTTEVNAISNNQTTLDVDALITKRLAFLAEKNFAEADRIRDELLSQGIQLKDSKDSQTGERITTWEVKR